MPIASTINNLGKDGKDIADRILGTKVGNRLFKKASEKSIEKNLDAKLLGVELKTPWKVLGGAALIGPTAFEGYEKSSHRGSTGIIEYAPLANTIASAQETLSPQLNEVTQMLSENPEMVQRFAKENLSRTQTGVDPSIVFALHELRNGGGA